MDYYQTITAHLLGETQLIKCIRADEANALPRAVITKLRQAQPTNSQLRTIVPEDILAVVNIKTCRLLKLTGKVWDQLSTGDEIWLVAPKEWKEHSEKVLIHECKIRHGKKLMIRNPAALSPRQLFDMVELYFPDIDKTFTELASPAATPPSKVKPASATKEKAPFPKAHKGSPNKNGALLYSERRKHMLSSPSPVDAAVGNDNIKSDGSPSPIGKRKINGSPANLTPSNREQTILPPVSPTLLRRVGLGRNLELSPIEQQQNVNEDVESELRLESRTSPHLLVDLDAVATEERKDGAYQQADYVAAVAVAEDGSSRSSSSRGSSRSSSRHSLAPSLDHSTSSAGPYSDVNVVGDDATLATLATFTNSVANSGIASSVHDMSTTPGNTLYGYESRRGRGSASSNTGGAPVVEIDLQGLLGTPALEIEIDNDVVDEDRVAAGINLGQEDFYYEVDSVGDEESDTSSGEGPPRSPLSSNSSRSESNYPEANFDRRPQESQAVSPSHVHSFTFGPTSENVMVLESLDDADDNRPVAESTHMQPPRTERRRVRLEFHPQHDDFAHGQLRGTRSEESPSPYLGSGSHREWSEMEDIMSVGDVSALSELSVNSGLVSHPLLYHSTRPAAALLGELEEELESQQDSEDTDGPVELGVDVRHAMTLRSSHDSGDPRGQTEPESGETTSGGDHDRHDDDCVDASIVPVVDSLEEQSIITDMPLSRPGSPRAYTNDVSVISSPTGASSLQEASLSGSGADLDDTCGTDSASVRPVVPSQDDRSILTDLPLSSTMSASQSKDCLDTVHSEVTAASLPEIVNIDNNLPDDEDADVSMVPIAGSCDDQSILTEIPVPAPAIAATPTVLSVPSELGVAELPSASVQFVDDAFSPSKPLVTDSEKSVVQDEDGNMDASTAPPVDNLEKEEEASILTEVPPSDAEDNTGCPVVEDVTALVAPDAAEDVEMSEAVAAGETNDEDVEVDIALPKVSGDDGVENVIVEAEECEAHVHAVEGLLSDKVDERVEQEAVEEAFQHVEETEVDLCADASVLPLPGTDALQDDFSIATELLSVVGHTPVTPVEISLPVHALTEAAPVSDVADEPTQGASSVDDDSQLAVDSAVDSLAVAQGMIGEDGTLSEFITDILTGVVDQVQVQVRDSLEPRSYLEQDHAPLSLNVVDTVSTLSAQSLTGEVATEEESVEEQALVQHDVSELVQAVTESEEIGSDYEYGSTQAVVAEETTPSELSLSTKSLHKDQDGDENETESGSMSGVVLETIEGAFAQGIASIGLQDSPEDLPVVHSEEVPLPGRSELATVTHATLVDAPDGSEETKADSAVAALEEVPEELVLVEQQSEPRNEEVAVIIAALADEVVLSKGMIEAEVSILVPQPSLEGINEEFATAGATSSTVDTPHTDSTQCIPSGSSEGVEVAPTDNDDAMESEGEESLQDDLTFSADLVCSADNLPHTAHDRIVALLLLPLGLSDSLESVELVDQRDEVSPESEQDSTASVTPRGVYADDRDDADGGASDTESALDALFDSLAGELNHLSEEFHHSMDVAAPPVDAHSTRTTPSKDGWQTPPKTSDVVPSGEGVDVAHSPLMASSSMLIALSPDRELEYSSRFIQNAATPMSSRASSSDHEGDCEKSSHRSSPSAPDSETDAEDIVPSDTGMSELSPSPSEKMNRASDVESVPQAQTEQETPMETLNFSTDAIVDAPVAQVDPPAAPVLSTEVALELQVKVQRQAEELAEANRVKAALEARLDETRQLLQIFASGRAMPVGAAVSPTGRSKISAAQLALLSPQPSYHGDIDLDALENTLMSDSVQSIAAEGLHHLSDYGGGPASSSKMRKSLRRLLDRKRDEKSRGSPRSLANRKMLRSGDSHHHNADGEEDSPILPHSAKQKPRSRVDNSESSDSGMSSDSRSNPSLPRSAYSSPHASRKAPVSAHSAAKSDRAAVKGSGDSVEQKGSISKVGSGSIGIADNNPVSVDELEMEVKFVQGLVLHGSTESTFLDSSKRPVLDLTDIYSSQSSDAQSQYERDKRAVVVEAEEKKRNRGDSSPPPPPPPSLPLVHSQSETSTRSENEVPAPPPRSPPKRPQNLNISVSEDVICPKNQHILSPRHLNVEMSSSSEDEMSEVSMRSFVQPKAPPATAVSLLKPQPAGGSSHTSPKAAAAQSSSTLSDPKSMGISNPVDVDSAQGSEGDYSSEESQNPLLLMSTPKIRGLGRPRPLQPPTAMPLVLGASGSVQFSEVPEVMEYDRLHSHFFQDQTDSNVEQSRKAVSPPRRAANTSLLPSGETQSRSNDTFLYNYDGYHAMRPDLFLDSGPNSPFNPHSPFQHPSDSLIRRQNESLTIMGRIEEQRFASDLSARLNKEELCSHHDDILSETQANTVANANITSNLTAMLKATRAATPNSAEKVKFSDSPLTSISVLEPQSGANEALRAMTPPLPSILKDESRMKTPSPPVWVADTKQEVFVVPEIKRTSPSASSTLVVEEAQQVLSPPAAVAMSPFAPVSVSAPFSPPSTRPVLPQSPTLPPPRQSTSFSVPVSAAKAASASSPVTHADKLAALFAYSLPMLVTARYMENSALRGLTGRQEIARTTGLRELLAWCVFQAYGTPDGAIVKGIKMIQVVRALKDAEVCTSITTSQLDLLLTKINLTAKAATATSNASAAASGVAASHALAGGAHHMHPSLLATSRVLKKTSATAAASSSSTGTLGGSNGTGNSSKGEQNSNSLAGASFSTFCALMNAIAGIIFSSDVKIRQRALKKGVTLGDLTTWNASSVEDREASCLQLDRQWRILLEKRDSLEAVKVLQEVQMSVSGIMQRTSYRRLTPRAQSSLHDQSQGQGPLGWVGALAGSVWAAGGVRQFTETELEAVRQVWDRNADQIRQIYGFYAASKEPRRQGSGPSKLLVSFEHCREALVDFQVLPHVVDAQGYARLFKVCKMWELEVAEQLLLIQEAESDVVSSVVSPSASLSGDIHGPQVSTPSSAARRDRGPGPHNLFIRTDLHLTSSQLVAPSPGGGQVGGANSVSGPDSGRASAGDDPLDLKGSVGNLCLSLSGFMELLTRIALGQQKLGARPQEALENLMHIMDASDGKAKLIRASRKSTSVRHFVYGLK